MSESQPTVLLRHHLKTLRLPTMERECEKVAARTASENADHLTFLLQLVELEMLERERRSSERRLKAAKFPYHKTLDEFDFAAARSVNKPMLLELMRGDYLDRRENLLLVGSSGTGKTHLATALGMEACNQGKRVRFHRVTELITLLMEARDERQLLRLRGQLGKCDLLILDELGYVPASKAGAELLFDIISTAYERQSLIVTTNLPVRELDRGSDQRTSDRRNAGPANASLPHLGNGWRELSPGGRQASPQTGQEEGGMIEPPPRLTDKDSSPGRHAFRPPGATLFNRRLHFHPVEIGLRQLVDAGGFGVEVLLIQHEPVELLERFVFVLTERDAAAVDRTDPSFAVCLPVWLGTAWH